MQVTKGVGSVVNGFESISGQVNIELINQLVMFLPSLMFLEITWVEMS